MDPRVAMSKDTKSNTNNAFRFMDLPRELQDQILHFSCVVCRFQHVDEGTNGSYVPQGVWIRNGKLRYPWASMLSVSHYFSGLAKEFLFSSNNRFILSGDPSQNREWLSRQSSEHLLQITKLDLLLEWDDLKDFTSQDIEEDDGQAGYDGKVITFKNVTDLRWSDLIDSLSRLFDISKLHLSVDAAFINIILRGGLYAKEGVTEPDFLDGEPFEEIKQRYWTIFRPFDVNKSILSKLASYQIFLPIYRNEETRFERALMGPEYDSVAQHGKDAFADRDPRLPHGTTDFEWEYFYLETTPEEQDKIYKKITTMFDVNDHGHMMLVWN